MLQPAVFHILLALADEDRHGYAIIQDVLARTNGDVRLSPGTLYRSVQRMMDDNLIEEVQERPAPELDDERRRYYRLTTDRPCRCARGGESTRRSRTGWRGPAASSPGRRKRVSIARCCTSFRVSFLRPVARRRDGQGLRAPVAGCARNGSGHTATYLDPGCDRQRDPGPRRHPAAPPSVSGARFAARPGLRHDGYRRGGARGYWRDHCRVHTSPITSSSARCRFPTPTG